MSAILQLIKNSIAYIFEKFVDLLLYFRGGSSDNNLEAPPGQNSAEESAPKKELTKIQQLYKALEEEKVDINIVRKLLDDGIDINGYDEGDEMKRTPLMNAAGSKSLEAVALMIERGANINARDAGMWANTPLMFASSPAIAALLLKHGAELEAPSGTNDFFGSGLTAFGQAALSGNMELATFFLDNGANVNVTNSFGTSILQMVGCGMTDMMKVLIDRGANVNQKNSADGTTVLMDAAQGNNLEMVKLLIERGADVNAKNNSGETALSLATKAENTGEVVSYLRARGATD